MGHKKFTGAFGNGFPYCIVASGLPSKCFRPEEDELESVEELPVPSGEGTPRKAFTSELIIPPFSSLAPAQSPREIRRTARHVRDSRGTNDIQGVILAFDQKVSLYVSLLNEAATVDTLLESLLAQTRPPDELIIIDGGSIDGTLEKVLRYESSISHLRIIRLAGSNIGEARNAGFSASVHDLVASTDAGCRADVRWLENLMRMIAPHVDVVSGVYLPDPQTLFEKCVGDLMYPKVEALPDDWSMPSHRSVLVRKRVWEALGGFPPDLDRSEDTWFDLEAVRRGFRFRLARDAVVHWRPRRNLVEVFKNTFRWTSSDVEHSIAPAPSSNYRTVLGLLGGVITPMGWCLAVVIAATMSPLLGLPSLLLLTAFLVRPFRVVRRFRGENSARAVLWKNLILYTNSVAWVSGYFWGLLARTRQSIA